MSKLNTKARKRPISNVPSRPNFSKAVAPEGLKRSANGNLQGVKDPAQVLVETLASTLYGVDSFYETTDSRVQAVRDALAELVLRHGTSGVKFALRAALFARQQMQMRTMPIVMAVELASVMRQAAAPETSIRPEVASLISRADELTDLYSYAMKVFGSKNSVPLSLKRAIGDAFNRFDAYQLAKYNRPNALTLRDLLRIVHPKPIDAEHAEIFSKLVANTLEPPLTWEVELSKNGQLPKAEQRSKQDLWTELVTRRGKGEVGYMGLLRNLRNLHEAGISDATWKLVAARLRDPAAVAKSKQLPFRFLQAIEIAKDNGLPKLVQDALNDAIELSLSNLPKLGDRVWIILDSSGSMNANHNASKGAAACPIKTGAVFAAALAKASKGAFEVRLTMFDNYSQDVPMDSSDSLMRIVEKIMTRNAGGGTNLQSALDRKSKLGFEPDTVIIISDMQVNQLSSQRAAEIFTPSCVKVAINLAAGTTTPLMQNEGWIQLFGWSENIFKFVRFSRDQESIVDQLWRGQQVAEGLSADAEEVDE